MEPEYKSFLITAQNGYSIAVIAKKIEDVKGIAALYSKNLEQSEVVVIEEFDPSNWRPGAKLASMSL